MANTDPGALAEKSGHQYDWQNPNRKSFDFGRVFGRSFTSLFASPRLVLIAIAIGLALTVFIGFIFIWPGWALAGPMMVHENKGVFSSLGASWNFSKGNKRYIFLLLLVMAIIGIVVYSVALGIGMMFTGVNVMAGDPTAMFNMSIGQQLIYNGTAGLGGYFLYALFASALTYFEDNCHEAFDDMGVTIA